MWEVVKGSKNLTKYGKFLPKDSVRGHAYVWKIKLQTDRNDWKEERWRNRMEILKANNVNFNVVGALKDIPRIKVLGRKVWLCKEHIRIFDKKHNSYYGDNAIQSKRKAFSEVFLIVKAIESKLGLHLRPYNIEFVKEHYALIKNDLAIDQNKKGIIWRVSDESGEWLLIDDSLGEGGELENVGKSALETNVPMQKWWNNQKETDFKVTPQFILNTMNGIQQNQQVFDQNMKSHLEVLKKLGNAVDDLKEEVKKINK